MTYDHAALSAIAAGVLRTRWSESVLVEVHFRGLAELVSAGFNAPASNPPISLAHEAASVSAQLCSGITAVGHDDAMSLETSLIAGLSDSSFGGFQLRWIVGRDGDPGDSAVAVALAVGPLGAQQAASESVESVRVHLQNGYERDWIGLEESRCRMLVSRVEAWLQRPRA